VSSSGGSILTALLNSDKPTVKSLQISALVRSEEQAKRLIEIGVTPILFTDLNDAEVIQKAASKHDGECSFLHHEKKQPEPAYSCYQYG
jgi:hypothetical protein